MLLMPIEAVIKVKSLSEIEDVVSTIENIRKANLNTTLKFVIEIDLRN